MTAVARDIAGNVATSAPVAITVSNWRPPAGLVAAYTFDEVVGIVAADASGNGHTGSLSGGASWTPTGRFGGAVAFDGSSGLVSIPDAAALDFTSALTIEAWVRPSSRNNWKTIVVKGAGSTPAYALYSSDNRSRPRADLRLGSNTRSVDTKSALPLNAWSHVAVTYASGRLRLYVNGSLVSSKSYTGTIRTSNEAVTIGGSTTWGRWFAGIIDEVRLYNRELSAAEIQAGMNGTLSAGN